MNAFVELQECSDETTLGIFRITHGVTNPERVVCAGRSRHDAIAQQEVG